MVDVTGMSDVDIVKYIVTILKLRGQVVTGSTYYFIRANDWVLIHHPNLRNDLYIRVYKDNKGDETEVNEVEYINFVPTRKQYPMKERIRVLTRVAQTINDYL